MYYQLYNLYDLHELSINGLNLFHAYANDQPSNELIKKFIQINLYIIYFIIFL